MKDLADHLGVSRQLVSLVMRDLPGASDATRKRVRAAAADLGYYPDASARALRGRRSFQLGVVFSMHEPFEVDLVESLFDVATERGYSLVLGPLTETRRKDAVVAQLLGQRIEGLVVLAADGGSSTIAVLPERIPVVLLGGPSSPAPLDDVRVDDEVGIELLVEHLVGLGHERIAHATGGAGPNAHARRDAYLSSMRRRDLPPDVVESSYTEAGGATAAAEFLSRPVLPTAIMAANDRCGVGLLATMVRHRISVPEDVSIVGFDDSSVARLPFVQLTTVRYSPRSLAEQALDAVIRRIDAPSSSVVAVKDPPQLVVRRSSGPARARR